MTVSRPHRLTCAILGLLLAAPTGGAIQDGQQLEAAAEALTAGQATRAELGLHARTLLDGGDFSALGRILEQGTEAAVLGVLDAVRVAREPSLLGSIVRRATGQDGVLATSATQTVCELARAHAEVVLRLADWSADAGRSERERRVAVECLGASKDLRAVPPMLGLLEGPLADAAHAALVRLTGHRPGVGAEATVWRRFWEDNKHLCREELLERELELERTRSVVPVGVVEHLREQLRQRDAELADHRAAEAELTKDLMGTDVDRLVAELDNELPGVRLEAARRLERHSVPDHAASALPALLQRLGAAPVEPPDPPGAVATELPAAPLETDADVRAALVAAVGQLGRNEPGVTDVLLRELGSVQPGVARAAVLALQPQHGQAVVVEPLLDWLRGRSADEHSATIALRTIAANEPSSAVLTRLALWVGTDHSPDVRAAAVGAILATPDLGAALATLTEVLNDEADEVRFAVARALGKRAADLGPEAPELPDVSAVLAGFVTDLAPSVRARAASALGVLGNPASLDLLVERTRVESDVSVLDGLVEAIGALGSMDGVDDIGRVAERDLNGQARHIGETAQDAISAIGRDRGVADWMGMARALDQVTAHGLAAWCYGEIGRRFGAQPEARQSVDEAAGLQTEALFAAGRHEEARTRLERLADANASHPSAVRRLELLARCHEALGDMGAAAGLDLERLNLIGAGEASRRDAMLDAVRTLLGAGRAAEAEPLVVELLAALADDALEDSVALELSFDHARVHAQLGRGDEALGILKALEQRLGDEAPLRLRVDALRQRIGASAGDPSPVDGDRDIPAGEGVEEPVDVNPDDPTGDGRAEKSGNVGR